jgi:hypothetical protein
MSATVWPVRHVLAESLQAGAPAGVDELVVVHGRIIPETRGAPAVVPEGRQHLPPDIPKEARAMRRSVIAFVLIVAALLAAACTQPSSGGGSSAAPAASAPAAPASTAPKPGY